MLTVSAQDYQRVFEAERTQGYPVIEALEATAGYRLDRDRLEAAARVLACPIKKHAPSWQHGRVIYSLYRHYLAGCARRVLMLDVGTAKGFSALCAQWALIDAGVPGTVVSVDVIDPRSRDSRNTVAEVDAPKTLTELLDPWPEASAIKFLKCTGVEWLSSYHGRIDCAFVDGKHTGAVVALEGQLLSARQESGDLAIFDDVHLPDVLQAVRGLKAYDSEIVTVLPQRAYAIARHR
jgi:predicted O-methyltransferase YrrM